MADYMWNCSLLTPTAAGPPVLVAMNTVGGRTLTGMEQVVGNAAGYWTMQYQGITVFSDDQIREWNHLQGGLSGRAKTVLIPVFDSLRGPKLPVTATWDIASSPGAGTGYILVAGDVANLHPGMHFTVAERLYRITGFPDPKVMVGSDARYHVQIRPPLREALAIGTALAFDSTMAFRCRLASDDAMSGLLLDVWKVGNSPSVSFVEDV